MADREQYPACFGPYLRYAIDSDFENFFTDLENFGNFGKKLIFDENQFRLLLLIELKYAEGVKPFEQAMNANETFGTEFGPDIGDTRYATLRCKRAAVGSDS